MSSFAAFGYDDATRLIFYRSVNIVICNVSRGAIFIAHCLVGMQKVIRLSSS